MAFKVCNASALCPDVGECVKLHKILVNSVPLDPRFQRSTVFTYAPMSCQSMFCKVYMQSHVHQSHTSV